MRELGQTCIRAVEVGDLAFTRRWRNDPLVARGTLGRRFPITEPDEDAWFRSLAPGRFPTAVVWTVTDASGSPVGVGQLRDVDWIHRTAWFGIWIAPDVQGAGHGERATRLVVRHGLVELGLRQVRLEVLVDNERARRIYARVGFVDEARLSGAVLVDGAPADLVVMRIDHTTAGADR